MKYDLAATVKATLSIEASSEDGTSSASNARQIYLPETEGLSNDRLIQEMGSVVYECLDMLLRNHSHGQGPILALAEALRPAVECGEQQEWCDTEARALYKAALAFLDRVEKGPPSERREQ